MNIKQAKEYIRQTVLLYLKKDEYGDYRIPVVRQRPVFLLGAPGVGKTAIMEQVAAELGIALVSYSMTHHTRQSALGLPFISHKNYSGLETDISEYTMSEIIASVYETMEKSKKKEGILFLDEINCVSETLAPSMLQFLQYKVFGRHSVPEGWVVVTAGNPPEYNRSVREFDVVTLDRLKVLEVEPEYQAFKEYAVDKGFHSAILSFLELKKEYFYKIETTAKGRSYVTARGWEDLSDILLMYEEEGLLVDDSLIGQYLRNDRIVREFSAYYDLYNKYKRDYAIDEILSGNVSDIAIERAKKASFDERLSLVSMLLDAVMSKMKYVMEQTDIYRGLMGALRSVKEKSSNGTGAEAIAKYLDEQSEVHQELINSLKSAGAMSTVERKLQRGMVVLLLEYGRLALTAKDDSGAEAFNLIKESFDNSMNKIKAFSVDTSKALEALFDFVKKSFSEDGNEMLILITSLTANNNASGYIGRFGSADYQKYSALIMDGSESELIEDELKDLEL